MKIKYHDLCLKKNKVNKYNKTLILLLEDDLNFEKEIFKIRENNNVEIEKIEINNEHYNTKSVEFHAIIEVCFKRKYKCDNSEEEDLIKFFRKVITEIDNLKNKYSLPYEWLEYLFFLVMYDCIFFVDKYPKINVTDYIELEKSYRKVDLWNKGSVDKFKKRVLIEIVEPISFNEFINECKDLWPKINKVSIENSKETNQPLRKKITMKNIEVNKIIHNLRRDKLKFSEIANVLEEKHGLIYSDSDIRTIYSRYKKTISDLRK